jgi:methionine-rich copper-binding protein CopC
MKSMKLGMIWVLVGMGLAMLLSVGVLGSAQSVSAQDVTADPVLVGAGDIASCTSTGDEKTAKLLAGIDSTIAALGDDAYDTGTSQEFAHCYDNYKLPSEGGGVFDPTRSYYWGEFKARTMPAVGNHEYEDPSGVAQPYFDYFSATNGFQPPAAPVPNDPVNDNNHALTVGEGYYSYDLGSWHVVVLNSNCDKVGGCDANSPQGQWLQSDLANNQAQCTLAYFHHPRFSSSGVGNNSAVGPFWKALYDDGAEVVLNGHAHNYERFAPQDPDGKADPDYGISEFIVGTGGKSLNKFNTIRPNSEVQYNAKYGVIKLTLHPDGYDWQFVKIDGTVLPDPESSASCHGAPPTSTTDSVPPTVISTSPANNTTGIATANVTATFSEEMKASSIISPATTFKLVKLNTDGTTTKVTATVSYDAATKQAILDPATNLNSGTYKATVTTGAQDLAGNALDQKPDVAGNQSKSWKFTVQ